jgi:hypothetical protein
MPTSIPPKFNDDYIAAVSSLTHAAHSYRSMLFLVVDAVGDKAIEVMLKHEDLLNLSDAVINAWRAQLGHDTEDGKSA